EGLLDRTPRAASAVLPMELSQLFRPLGAGARWRFDTLPQRLYHVTIVVSNGALQTHAFQLAVQRLSLDPQDLGRAALVAAGRRQHAPDLLGLGVGERFAGAVARVHLIDRRPHGFLVD